MKRLLSMATLLLAAAGVGCAPRVVSTGRDAPRSTPSGELDDAALLEAWNEGMGLYEDDKIGEALPVLRHYIEAASFRHKRSPRFLKAVDHVARALLVLQRDPHATIEFLDPLAALERLTDAEEDVVNEWRVVAREWRTAGVKPKRGARADLYLVEDEDEPGATARIFRIAWSTDAPTVLRALRDQADHHRKAGTPDGDRARSLYLKEIIRRTPHTQAASDAFDRLDAAVRSEYGEKDDDVPESVRRMLAQYARLALPKTPTESGL